MLSKEELAILEELRKAKARNSPITVESRKAHYPL